MIRVLVVDDSLTVRERITELITAAGDMIVVDAVSDGLRACELAATLRPDVITLDLALPVVDGVRATEHIMAHSPTPILVVSSAENRGALFNTYEALAAGAVDVLDKAHPDDVDWEARFVAAVRLVSKIRVITHPRARLGALARHVPPSVLPVATPSRELQVVALGASTGGPGALVTVLNGMPVLDLPTFVVLHIDSPFAVSFAQWLGSQTSRVVTIASDREAVPSGPPGRVIFAPPDRHLVVERRTLRLVDSPPRNFCRPSIDTLFESVAAEYGAGAAAGLLTGMGRDGAAGLLAIRHAGGATFAQDEASSIVYGMPKEALAYGAVDRTLPLDELGPAIGRVAGKGTR